MSIDIIFFTAWLAMGLINFLVFYNNNLPDNRLEMFFSKKTITIVFRWLLVIIAPAIFFINTVPCFVKIAWYYVKKVWQGLGNKRIKDKVNKILKGHGSEKRVK